MGNCNCLKGGKDRSFVLSSNIYHIDPPPNILQRVYEANLIAEIQTKSGKDLTIINNESLGEEIQQ